jgi:hypothetical protein
LYRDSIKQAVMPKPVPPPYAICPECEAERSQLFAHLAELQLGVDSLRDLEMKYVPQQDRYKGDLKDVPERESAPSMTQAITFEIVEGYLNILDSTSITLSDATEKIQSQPQGISIDQDQRCLLRLAAEMEVHLYQATDAIGALGNRDIGIGRWNQLPPLLKAIAQRIDDHKPLSDLTIRRLNGTFGKPIYEAK